MAPLWMKLILDFVAWPAGAGAGRIAALHHKILDHTMKCRAVVEALACQEDEIVDRERRFLGIELDLDGSLLGMEDGVIVHLLIKAHFGRFRKLLPVRHDCSCLGGTL